MIILNSPLLYLLKKYSRIEIENIFPFFNNVNFNIFHLLKLEMDKNKIELIIKLRPELNKDDDFNWNCEDYLLWEKRNSNIFYLLIYSYK